MKSIGFKLTAIMLVVILLGIVITLALAMTIAGNSITNEKLDTVRYSTKYESERLDNWLMQNTTSISIVVDTISSMDNLCEILAADQGNSNMSLLERSNAGLTLEDQTVDIVRPIFRSILNDNDALFEAYIGFPDGSAVTGSGFRFDYSSWAAPQRGWYQLALTDTSSAHITSPYVDAQTGELCITVSHAVYYNGQLVGVVGADVFVTELQDITLAATLEDMGFSMLVDENGDILVHPDRDYAPNSKGEFQNLNSVKGGVYSEMWKAVSSSEETRKFKDADGVNQYYTGCVLPTRGWYMISVLPSSVVSQPIKNVILIVVPVAVAILLIAVFIIYLTIRNSISRPLAPLTAFFGRVSSSGDISLSQEDTAAFEKYSAQKDEIAQLISSASAFVGRIGDVSKAMRGVADGDLTHEVNLLSDRDEMGVSLKTMTDNLNQMFSEINASAEQVSAGSKQVADGSQALAQGATEQAASIEELSSAITEIASRTKENSETAEKAVHLADTIMDNAEKGSLQMETMTAAVKEINDASQSISKVIKTIDDIAFQTNILALNAAVEAARAGQHGKGFAVVAEEVRNLASKSAEAAKETGHIIENSIVKAELGSRIAGETASSLAEIVSGINESNQLINHIAKSSEEQSMGIMQINAGIGQVAQVVQQNSATAEESAAASEEMSGQSTLLQALISQFRLKGEDRRFSLPSGKQNSRIQPAPTNSSYTFNGSNDSFGKY